MEQKELLEDSRTQRLLMQLLQQQQLQTSALQKQLFFTRLAALLLAAVLLLVLAGAAAFLPQVRGILTNLDGGSGQLAAVDWGQLARQLNDLAQTSQQSLAIAAGQLEKLDLDALNQAIRELQAVVSPLANLFG